MRLSVIIVSYNVYPFLDNCLRSVQQAMEGIEGEIIVVDNASVDRTPLLVQDHFPAVKLIANTKNVGFAKANNQGIAVSLGEYIVLLNPDTVVSENTFSTCLDFMDTHPEAGAAGVRMLDGSGRFLPESKRGLPTLRASFMKMTGLYKIFPRSPFMNSYYQGHIDENETAPIEVLCGAFMFIRRSTLEKAGLLDEDFFMYGEDIDLSYRITKNGDKIYYLPKTSIIHYKGESTRKSSLNYILIFYQAMLIFSRKHPEFSGQQWLIRIAIYLHGFLRYIKHAVTSWFPPLVDGIALAGSYYAMSKIWGMYYFHQPQYFHNTFYYINIPLYTLIAITAMYLNGAYDKPYTRKSSWLGFGTGLIAILVIYAILPVHLRTSRMVILLGSLMYLVLFILMRYKLPPWTRVEKSYTHHDDRRAIIVAHQAEADRIKELINRSRDHIDIIGTVSPIENQAPSSNQILGPIDQLEDIIRVHRIKEVIFSAQDVPFTSFTSSMTKLGPGLRYMLAASATMNIVGSMNKDTQGESYAIRINFRLSHQASLRAKRIFDFMSSSILIILSPVLYFFLSSPRNALWKNLFAVWTGKKTWISYHPADPMIHSLPPIPPGILHPVYQEDVVSSPRRLEHIHYVYARDYHWTTDLSILASQLNRIGQTNVTA